MQKMGGASMIMSNKARHLMSIYLSSFAALLITASIAFCYKEGILFQFLRYKIFDSISNRIISYLSSNKKGLNKAITDLSNTRAATRGGAFYILKDSPCLDLDDILHGIVFCSANESNIIQIIELSCVMLERTGREEYLFRLYELVSDPHQFEMVNGYDYEIYLGRLCFLKFSENILTEQEFKLLAAWPRSSAYPVIDSMVMSSDPNNHPCIESQ